MILQKRYFVFFLIIAFFIVSGESQQSQNRNRFFKWLKKGWGKLTRPRQSLDDAWNFNSWGSDSSNGGPGPALSDAPQGNDETETGNAENTNSNSDDWSDPGTENDDEPGEINTDDNNSIPECTCVESDLCEEDYRVTATGSDLYDWRQGGSQCKENQVCCAKDIKPEVPELPAPEDNPQDTPEDTPEDIPEDTPEDTPQDTPEDTPQDAQEETPNIPENQPPASEPLGCGLRHKFDQAQNFGEGFAEFGEFPWVLKLRDADDVIFKQGKSADSESFKCGASLIHPSLALTAAHCLLNTTPESIVVRAGEWDVTNDNEPLPHQERLVKKIILHPNFEHKNPKNDIAILVLDLPFDMTDNVNVVCLPLPDDVLDTNKCVAAGWGQVEPEGEMQNVLKKITMPIVAKEECQNALRNTRLGKYFLLHDSFMCAGGGGVDTCVGDGGGPLMCPLPKTDMYVQLGVVSWGINCAKAGRPGVYANVEKFLEWIDQVAKAENLQIN